MFFVCLFVCFPSGSKGTVPHSRPVDILIFQVLDFKITLSRDLHRLNFSCPFGGVGGGGGGGRNFCLNL